MSWLFNKRQNIKKYFMRLQNNNNKKWKCGLRFKKPLLLTSLKIVFSIFPLFEIFLLLPNLTFTLTLIIINDLPYDVLFSQFIFRFSNKLIKIGDNLNFIRLIVKLNFDYPSYFYLILGGSRRNKICWLNT